MNAPLAAAGSSMLFCPYTCSPPNDCSAQRRLTIMLDRRLLRIPIARRANLLPAGIDL